jgi:hypothetical protein
VLGDEDVVHCNRSQAELGLSLWIGLERAHTEWAVKCLSAYFPFLLLLIETTAHLKVVAATFAQHGKILAPIHALCSGSRHVNKAEQRSSAKVEDVTVIFKVTYDLAIAIS